MTEELIYTHIRPVITFIIVVTLAYMVGSGKINDFFVDNDKNKRKYKRK
jgi:hypothetical protein